MIAEPLFPAPLKEIDTWPLLIAAEIEVGGVGSPAGTAAGEFADATPVPMSFIAFAVNVYEVPFVNPEILQLVAGARAVQVAPLLAAIR